MTNERAIELMKIEMQCINRAETCDRDCAKCELVQDTDELRKAYAMAISAITDNMIEEYRRTQQQKLKKIQQMYEDCEMELKRYRERVQELL